MRVLLIATNRELTPFPVAPLGVLCVAAAARRAGHEVQVLDLAFARAPERAVRRALAGARHDAVGLGIRNLDNCFWACQKSYVEPVGAVVRLVRELTDAPLIAGGGGFSVAPQGWMARLPLDYGVVGEGEDTFVRLLDALASGAPGSAVPGVIARGAAAPAGGGCAARPAAAIESPEAPAHDLCRYKPYLARGGAVGVQTRRGCGCQCVYCIYPAIEGAAMRVRPAEAVVDEMAAVARAQGVRDFYFTDGVFNMPRRATLELCHALARRRLGARWTAFCNPVGLDEELVAAMGEAGCYGIELGLDAATPRMLEAFGKPFDQAGIRQSLAACRKAGLPVAAHLLIGGPGESWADVDEAQRFLAEGPEPTAVFASIGVRVHGGTRMEALARAEGVLPEDADLFDPWYYVSPGLGGDSLAGLDAVARRRPEWSTPVDWNRALMRVVQFIVNRAGTRPVWRNVRNYGLHMRKWLK